MDNTILKPHECECLFILRINNTGDQDLDYVIVTLVEVPYQPHNVNRIRMALMREEENYKRIDKLIALVDKHIVWTDKAKRIVGVKALAIVTPESENVYLSEWVFADSMRAYDDYCERTLKEEIEALERKI